MPASIASLNTARRLRMWIERVLALLPRRCSHRSNPSIHVRVMSWNMMDEMSGQYCFSMLHVAE